MGAGQSVEESAEEDGISFNVKVPRDQQSNSLDSEDRGSFHVLKVEDNSPAEGKLVPFLDFITAVNGKALVCA
jgi:hypothetical protein